MANRSISGLAAEALSLDQKLTVSEWADLHRVLSTKAAAEPGRWRTSRTPYLREILDALSPDSPVTDIWTIKGAQLGFTECGINWVGYVIDHAPGPMLFVQPTVDMANRAVRQRIDPLIDDTPQVARKVGPKRAKDGGNSLSEKHFPGGVIVMAGANSAAGLRSMPVRYLFLDEVDAYPGDLDGEGDPVALAHARTRTFRRAKRLHVSTPTVRGASRIEAGFLQTDQRRYFVPCPHCGEFQLIDWKRIRWDRDNLKAPAWLECVANGCVIAERHKPRMLGAGEWRPTAETLEGVGANVRGYHISSLYSPLGWYSWTNARDDFLEVKDDPARLKTWTNTVLGETWVERGDAPPWRRLYARREPYPMGSVPEGGRVLTAGADVQKDRIEVEVRAWGPRMESWSIDYRVFDGDTADVDGPNSPWARLSALLSESFSSESGTPLQVRMLAVDSGFQTQAVYHWARSKPQDRVAVVKGTSNGQAIVQMPRYVDVTWAGKRIRRGMRVWSVGVDIAKGELYGWLRTEEPSDSEQKPVGWLHFPEYGEEYFRQLTAEELVSRPKRTGHLHFEWVKRRERNEALDCAVYARAAAAIVGVDRMVDADRHSLLARRPGSQPTPGRRHSIWTPPTDH
jgi:phage terminase large subunit GpA-like protein